MENKNKEFKISSWAIDNKTTIYVLTVIITLVGILSYIKLPKEKFPDIVIPTIYVATVYPGTSPKDMENLVTKPLEKQIKAISGVKKLTSSSVQDFSTVIVEFNTGVDVPVAKQKVKDAVDKARADLPNDLPRDPNVVEVDFSEMPILYVNISGNYDLSKLKKYADDIKDQVEGMKEITRVDVIGALDREIQINVDKYKMEASAITMRDIESAVEYENMNISGGQVSMDGMKRSLSVSGQFKNPKEIENITIRSMSGATVLLKDIAEVSDTYKEKASFARLNHKNVITLNIIKRSGENLIEASDKVRAIVADLQKEKFPSGLTISLTGDQSSETRTTLHDLINTIIIGFILITIVLMFFMGVTNALFVALSVPLSMFLAFLILPLLGFSLNMIVLFAFLLSLGVVVDDAIVVIENTHRIFDNGKMPIKLAAKMAAGEVFVPVLAGTLTTVAPFIPLAFWGGVIGKFMFFLPITLIVALTASLLVAYIINPVFAVDFMKPHDPNHNFRKLTKGFWITTIVMGSMALMFYVIGNFGMGNFTITMFALYVLNKFILTQAIKSFQEIHWPKVQNGYEKLLQWSIKGKRPALYLAGTVLLFFVSFVLVGIRKPKVVFFPQSEPNFIYVYLNLPVGTDQIYTDSVTKILENRVFSVIGEKNPLVESVISNVAIGAGDPQSGNRSTTPQKGKITIAFVEFAERDGQSTLVYLDKIREAVKGIPSAEITVEQEQGGPPTGKPISIEISGDNLEDLIVASENIRNYLVKQNIAGIEELKSDLLKNKPELIFKIDRERANREGISTAQIGMEIRTAVFGKEVSKFKDANDEYPIQLRFSYENRNNIQNLLNMKITYRDMNMGGEVRQIPLSSVATAEYSNTYGGINRKNQKRMITLSSNVLTGYNANEVVEQITNSIATYPQMDGITFKMGGQQEEQKETGAFLVSALLIALGLIMMILVFQFNSVSKPLIIVSEIFFSIIGVLLGFSIFGLEISIVMTGIGIVALAGIVVKNGILIVEFTDTLRETGMNLETALIQAGKARMTPVLLTAIATILGLVPLAVGLNIDFVTLFTELNPHIFFGGDSVAFWGPLSWTMIYGLIFATFLTLVLVPCMYYISESLKLKLNKNKAQINLGK